MNKAELDDLEKEILITWARGGSFAHNIVRASLQQMAEHDRERADHVYKKLQKRGY